MTTDYLGPAARRFIDRQIENHLDKKPDDLTVKDLLSLVDWIRVAVSLLTEDTKLVKEFTGRLLSLTKPTKRILSHAKQRA